MKLNRPNKSMDIRKELNKRNIAWGNFPDLGESGAQDEEWQSRNCEESSSSQELEDVKWKKCIITNVLNGNFL